MGTPGPIRRNRSLATSGWDPTAGVGALVARSLGVSARFLCGADRSFDELGGWLPLCRAFGGRRVLRSRHRLGAAGALVLDREERVHHMTRTRNNVGLLLLAGGLTISAVALVGCDQRDEASSAIESAGQRLAAIVSDGPGVPTATRQSAYDEVIRSLSSVASSGTESQAESASALLAEAHAGLGQLAAASANEMDLENERAIRRLRVSQDNWESFSSLATALVAQDAASEFADLDRQIESRSQEIVDARRDQEEVEGQISSLDAQIRQAEQNARSARQRETMLRQDAINQSQTQRAATFERLREESRRGDSFDQRAAMLRADRDRLAPTLADISGLRERLESQAELLATAREDLTRLLNGRRDQAAGLREKASGAASEVVSLTQEIQGRHGEVPGAWDAAVQHYDKAIQSARRAGDRLSQAGFSRARAAALLGKAHSETGVASALSLLAGSPTKLPTDYSSAAAAAKQAAAAAATEARNAYTDVIGALDSAASGPLADRMDSVTSRLTALGDADKLNDRDGGSQADPPSDDSAADDAAESASAGDPEAEVWALVDQMIEALDDGDIRRAREMISGPERELALLDQMIPVLEAASSLDEAFVEAFGTGFTELAAQSPNPMMAQMAGGMSMSVDRSNFEVVMLSDTEAEVHNRDPDAQGAMSDTMMFTHDGSDWVITTATIPDAEYQQAQMGMAMMGPISEVFTGLAGDVRDGQFETAEPAMQALGMRLMQALGGGAGGPGGAGG